MSKTFAEDRETLVLSPAYEWSRHETQRLHFPGCRLARRQEIWRRIQGWLGLVGRGSVPLVRLVDDVPALFQPNYSRKDFDWIDRCQVRGLLRAVARCHVCGRIVGDPPTGHRRRAAAPRKASWRRWLPGDLSPRVEPILVHEHCFGGLWDRHQKSVDDVREVRLVGRQAKSLAKIAELMDVALTFQQAAALLPWRPHLAALRRMVQSGRLGSTSVGGERRLRGRDLLPLVREWVETGRAPWRHNNKTRALREEKPCPTNR